MQPIVEPAQEALVPYLPGTLIDRWASSPSAGPVWGHWLVGSLMHCDITGFTAMSEGLAQMGKEGAELMAAVLNRFFDRMLGVADRWGGVQMKFGGDAMLLFFSGRDHAAHAAACGLEMQTAISEFQRVPVGGQTHRLRIRIGIHCGRFFAASAGQPEGILHYLLLGPDVNRTAAVEAAAVPGQVVVSAESVTALGPECELAGTQAPGVWRVRSIEASPAAQPNGVVPAAPTEILRRYLMAPVADGRTAIATGEHRRVTALFVGLTGISDMLEREGDAATLAEVNAYMQMFISTLERHGGFLAGSDVAEQGDKLIAIFGAPVSHEHEEAASLRCALELRQGLQASRLHLKQRIGINSGFVFAGEIGSSWRREYTVIGDNVNLAARLLAAARPGQVILSASTAQRAGAGIDLRRLRPIRVKGKAAPVQAYRLEGVRELPVTPETAAAAPLVGREAELQRLLRLAQRAGRGRSRWAYICGEPGIGKSRLAAELVARLRARGWRTLTAYCQPHEAGAPFAAWIRPLHGLLGTQSSDSPAGAWAAARAEISRLRPDLLEFAPLVGELLSLPVADDHLLRSLDARTRHRRLTSTVAALLNAAAREQPLLLLVEDVHWIDGSSLGLLAEVLRQREDSLFVSVTSRGETPPPELAEATPDFRARLGELSPESALRLLTGAGQLDEQDMKAIVERARGNPLFLQEIARSGAVRQRALPDTVNDVIMARLDSLPSQEKIAMRFASVIGPSFDLPTLQGILRESAEAPVRQTLASLAGRGMLVAQEGEPPAYTFSHALAREVAYETILYAQRRQLHRDVAAYIERQRGESVDAAAPTLLHHYELAGDARKTALYGAVAGDRAAAIFANREAMDYYRRSLAVLKAAPGGTHSDRSALLERIGDCLAAAGLLPEAGDTLVQALDEWQAGRGGRTRFVPWRIDSRSREATLLRKVAVSHEQRSDYDESLRWLERALAALPPRPGGGGALVHAAKSMALFRKGLYEEAIRWGKRSLAISQRSGDLHLLAYAHAVLAGSHMEMGNLKLAIRHDREAVRNYHAIGDLPGQAMSNSNLGASYQLLGVLDAALYHYEIALQADKRLDNHHHIAIVQNNIGEVLLILGRLDEATAALKEVTRAHQDDAGLAAVAGLSFLNQCRCQLKQGDVTGAAAHLRHSMRLLRRVGAYGLLSEARLELAELRLAQGKPHEARLEIRRVLALGGKSEGRLLEARSLRLLGRAYAALREREPAVSHLRASVRLARQIGAEYEEARSLVALARVLLDDGRAQLLLAANGLQRALTVFSKMGASPDVDEARQLLERIQSTRGSAAPVALPQAARGER